jgi:hypothetical protein
LGGSTIRAWAVRSPCYFSSVHDYSAVINTADVVAVVDTNVMIDLHSCHDHTRVLHPALSEVGDAAWLKTDVWYRGTRARDAVLLAIYLDQIKATTWGSHGEFVEKLAKIVPPAPEKDGGQDWELDFATNVIHFVREFLLANWTHAMPLPAEGERGNAADKWLVAEALRLNVPLISNEGLRIDGSIDQAKNIRKLATGAGITVVTPRDFFNGRIDEVAAADAFQVRFIEQLNIYTRDRTDHLERMLWMMKRYYDVVLYFYAPGDGPFPTRVE